MYRHDYILRLIERFGAALIALRNRILQRKGDEVTFQTEIGEIARQAGLDLAVARTLDPEGLLMWLAPTGQPDPAKLWLMAELLYLEGLGARASEKPGWRDDMERALPLLNRLPPEWHPGEGLATAGERAAEIRRTLGVDGES